MDDRRERGIRLLDAITACINEHPIVSQWITEILDRKTESQIEIPCDTCANKGDHNGECSNCVADSEPIRWKTPSHYKPKTKSQKAIKDLQEYYGIKQEPMLSEMV